MPDRIVRQNILTSDRVNSLSWAAEVFYRRLMSVTDDYGRYEARPSILRAFMYPLKLTKVTDKDVSNWLDECANADLILIYCVGNKEYLEIHNYGQRLRLMRSKYPSPSEDSGCQQKTADVSNLPPETKRRESESETESEKKRKEVRAHSVPTVKNSFVIPTQEEVRDYFKKVMGNPKKPGSWPEDKCHMEADTLLDHYTANDWVQNKGKPIKDWKAACRNWIRNNLKGTFSPINGNKRPEIEIKTPKVEISGRPIDKTASEINFLYSRFCEDPDYCTIISVETVHYDYLKRIGKISFPEDRRAEIFQMATSTLQEKDLENNQLNMKMYMKKIGVIEFFKDLKKTEQEAVFHGN